jgi:ribosomal protein L7Ae-like RNA K-turn-binding protein
MHLPALCEEKKIPLVEVEKKEDLGIAAGLGVSTTAIAIVEEGEAKVIIKQLTK